METSVKNIRKYSVWLARVRMAVVSAEFGLYGEPTHRTQYADITDDQPVSTRRRPFKARTRSWDGFTQNLDVAVQDLLGYLVAVWNLSAAPPFVISAAGDAKQPAKHSADEALLSSHSKDSRHAFLCLLSLYHFISY